MAQSPILKDDHLTSVFSRLLFANHRFVDTYICLQLSTESSENHHVAWNLWSFVCNLVCSLCHHIVKPQAIEGELPVSLLRLVSFYSQHDEGLHSQPMDENSLPSLIDPFVCLLVDGLQMAQLGKANFELLEFSLLSVLKVLQSFRKHAFRILHDSSSHENFFSSRVIQCSEFRDEELLSDRSNLSYNLLILISVRYSRDVHDTYHSHSFISSREMDLNVHAEKLEWASIQLLRRLLDSDGQISMRAINFISESIFRKCQLLVHARKFDACLPFVEIMMKVARKCSINIPCFGMCSFLLSLS